jgi:diadenosine tetraphosphatase ApaH/serine/threonine PP2A family protein phosphatase
MRIALLADLHANRDAVEACLRKLDKAGHDQLVLLGDLVGYGPDPAWVVDFAREAQARGAIVVRGNHDEAVATVARERMHETARRGVDWTRDRLDDDQRAWLRDLPLSVRDEDRLYVHANAHAPAGWGYVNSRLAATHSLAATDAWLTCCGHEHAPALYHTHPGQAACFTPQPGFPMPLAGGRRWLAIPGACGQPRDGNPAAACALLDTRARSLTFLRVPYDHDAVAARLLAAGLPAELARRLAGGH